MSIEIQTRIEDKRGCGWRKPGGIYLVGPPTGQPCCKLPFPLTTCPCCGAGIKPSRGWTWVDGSLFIGNGPPISCMKELDEAMLCPLSNPIKLEKCGLLWVGEGFYKTPADFLTEARNQGISRRLSTVPKGFEPGKTWVLLAHRFGHWLKDPEPEDYDMDRGGKLNPEIKKAICKPAIFSVFRPMAIEYVVRGDETEEELERVVARGMVPVDVNPRRAYK